MFFLLQLATRNLFRNFRRTLLSMVAVVAGVWVLIMGQGFIGGIDEDIIRGDVDDVDGHVILRPKDYPNDALIRPVDKLLTVTPDLAKFLDENAAAWTTRVWFSPRAIHGAEAARVRAIGYDPKKDATVFPRDTWHVDGKIPEKEADGVLVSQSIARVLVLKAGDTVTLEVRTPDGAINALEVPVSGLFTTGNPALDHFAILVPSDLVSDLLRNGDKVSHVNVRLASRDDALAFADQLQAHVPAGAEVSTWVAETHDMMQLQLVRRRALGLLVLALLGMSATSIANTILMAAYERVREIGTLRAMGMTRGGVVRMFLLEGGMMGFVGAAVGATLGGAMVWHWSVHGIDLTAQLANVGGNLPIAAMLYLAFQPAVILGATAFGVLVATAASIYPALVASGMQPAEAVRAD